MKPSSSWGLFWGVGVWAAAAGPSLAQPLEDTTGVPVEPAPGKAPTGLPDLDVTCPGASRFGGSELEQAAFCRLERREYVSLRTLADQALDQNPESFRAHFLMGVSQHLGEANLAKSRFHLEEALERLENAHGAGLDPEHPAATVERSILIELVYVYGEMDRHEEKIAAVDALSKRSGQDYGPLKAWPLMKLARYQEAQELADRAAESPLQFFRAVGKTALCAIESEQRHREAAYQACRAAAEPYLNTPSEGAIELTNAGAAAEEMGFFAEAERLYSRAATRPPEGSVNPYGRLVALYMRQGRLSEALSAWSRMRDYRARRPQAHLDQQDEAEATMLGATLLMLSGRSEDAAKLSHRLVERPDRKGTSSAAAEQSQAGVALVDHVVQSTRAARLAEQASYGTWSAWFALQADRAWHRMQAWRSGRRVRQVLANPVRLRTTLRPEVPGSIEGPTWLDPHVISLVGSGVARSVIAENRGLETLEAARAEPIFDVLEATAWARVGSWSRVDPLAARAFRRLGDDERMLKTRAALLEARSAEAAGQTARAVARWIYVMQNEPGFIRREGMALPVAVHPRARDPEAAQVADWLLGSPRFRSARWGLRLEVDSSMVRLAGPDQVVLREVRADEAGEGPSGARAFVDQVHRELFRPVLDLTQVDLQSLDGIVGGGMDSDQVDRVLDQILEGGAP